MPRFNVPSRSRAWTRVVILSLIGIAAAGCSDSARFGSDRVAYRPLPPADVTGSIPQPQAQISQNRVVSQPLPAPSAPPVYATSRDGGYASGGQGLGAYHPAHRETEVARSARPSQPPAPTRSEGHWSWSGGSAVVVGRGETLAAIARQHRVPVSAIMKVNGIRHPSEIRPGQHIVIPRYVAGEEPHATAPRLARRGPEPRSEGNVHVAGPGDTLIGIARRHNMSLSQLARLNHMSPYTKLSIGDRVIVPGGSRQVASRERAAAPEHRPVAVSSAPKVAQPRTVPSETVASVPTESARLAKPEIEPSESVTKKAEPAGGIPSFRWPVKGRIIASFGRQPNGTENDGINLAVPEGTPIKAADDGVVAYAGNELKGYGNLVLIRHPDGYVSAYANASKLLVTRGEHVKRGQVIARAGQTGNVTSPQLHFEIRKGSTPVDPTKYLGG